MPIKTLLLLITLAAGLVLAACNKDKPPTCLNPLAPGCEEPGPDPDPGPQPWWAAPKQMVDGAGNSGPLTIAMKHFQPGGVDGILTNVSLEADVEMDSILNPTGSPYLAEMRFIIIGSADRATPLGIAHDRSPENGVLKLFIVPNGGKFTVSRRSDAPTPPRYFSLDPASKYLMFIASFSPREGGWFYNWIPDPCPPYDIIAAWPWPRPQGARHCVLKTDYELVN